MIDLSPIKHFAVLNGSHWVRLCNPSLLATPAECVKYRSLVVCPACHAALAEDDNATMNREIFKKMNDLGRPMK